MQQENQGASEPPRSMKIKSKSNIKPAVANAAGTPTSEAPHPQHLAFNLKTIPQFVGSPEPQILLWF
jgi:hypothetical protein